MHLIRGLALFIGMGGYNFGVGLTRKNHDPLWLEKKNHDPPCGLRKKNHDPSAQGKPIHIRECENANAKMRI